MDRQVTQTNALIPNATLLGGQKAAVFGLGYALQAALGTGTVVDGLACNPTSPASLSVTIGAGSIMTYAAIDPTAFGDLGVDTTHFTMKQGLLQEPGATLTITPPGTAGYSQVYLVQAQYADGDSYTVLPFYNPSNPTQPYNGPANSGNSSLTLRQSLCTVQLKQGAAAATGTQVAPTPDAGWTPLYLITVANGTTQITLSNVSLYPTAPFLDLKLPQVRAAIQAQAGNYAIDGGTANQVIVALPAYTPSTLTLGTPVRIKKGANANTAAMTVVINGTSYPVVTRGNVALSGGEWAANELRTLIYDGTSLRLEGTGGSGSVSSGWGGLNGAVEQWYGTAGTTNWTVPAGVTAVLARVWGGGGGGGGSISSPLQGGGGGGGGGYTEKLISGLTPGAVISITVGAGGTAGVSGSTSQAGNGGTSSFGAYISATGGIGGDTSNTAAQGGSGGTGSGGTINLPGGYGGLGNNQAGGVGGAAGFGGGTGASYYTAGNSPGGGGSGAQPAGYPGYAGAPGAVLLLY